MMFTKFQKQRASTSWRLWPMSYMYRSAALQLKPDIITAVEYLIVIIIMNLTAQ